MSLGRKTLLANFASTTLKVALCGECAGKGFALASGKQDRHCRRCPKCKGADRDAAGPTKR